MNMIEQVARAILERRHPMTRPADIWLDPATLEDARAAVEAMRVPTEAMVMSQGKSRPALARTEAQRESAERLNAAVRNQAKQIWAEMIDAALEKVA